MDKMKQTLAPTRLNQLTWRIDKTESIPSKVEAHILTPITGKGVRAVTIPDILGLINGKKPLP